MVRDGAGDEEPGVVAIGNREERGTARLAG